MPDPAITHLRAVLQAARCGEPLPPDAAGWLLAGGTRYIAAAEAGNAVGLDVALGLGRPGRHGWWTVEARKRRDALLRELRQRQYPHLDDGEAARQIATLARRANGAAVIVRPAAEANDLLLSALCTGLGIPGAKQLRAIIGKSPGA